MYYVKVENEVVTTSPTWLSSNPTATPNSHWSESQMGIWGFVIVDISFNPNTETIDLSTPTVNGNGSVTYTRTQLTSEQLSALALSQLIASFNPAACIAALYTEFSDRAALVNEWGALVAWLIQFKNFPALKELANSQLSGQDLTDFKAVFTAFNIDLDNF